MFLLIAFMIISFSFINNIPLADELKTGFNVVVAVIAFLLLLFNVILGGI